MKVMVINGPNLNMLGQREPEIYGNKTLDDINGIISEKAQKLGISVEFFQSDIEGEIIRKIHSCREGFDGIILNAGAFTHYSYAIRDALTIPSLPVVEVHMSNVFARESFRHKSVLSDVCSGVVCGFGAKSYLMALCFFAEVDV